jgi:biopolymer transport protein ExbB/TolQ
MLDDIDIILTLQIVQLAPEGDGAPIHIIVVVLLCVLVLLVNVLVFPSILARSRLVSRTRRDYEQARGTQHLRQIRDSLEILNKKLKSLEQEKQKLNSSLRRVEPERRDRLSRALCRRIVETQLTEVDGIGPTLRDRIISYCFDGTLDSLLDAYLVHGVGQQKQWAIQRWVAQRKRELPARMSQDFPGKKRINAEYNRLRQNLEKKLREAEEKLEAMRQLQTAATAEEERLSRVTAAHFLQAHQQDTEASEAVDQYLQGTFAEWASMPDWFRTLISEYGG